MAGLSDVLSTLQSLQPPPPAPPDGGGQAAAPAQTTAAWQPGQGALPPINLPQISVGADPTKTYAPAGGGAGIVVLPQPGGAPPAPAPRATIDVGGPQQAAPTPTPAIAVPAAAVPTAGAPAPAPIANVLMPAPQYSSPDLQAKMDFASHAVAAPMPIPPDQEFPVQPGQQTGYFANIAAGTSQGVAQTLGLPVDVTTALLNAGARAIGLPQIQNPVGGSQSLERLFGLIGANPNDVVPATQGERLARAAAMGATQVALPGGIASRLAAAALPGEAIAPAITTLAQGAGPGGAAVGAASGVGSEVGQEIAPEPLKPIAGIVGGMIAGMPVAGVTSGAATLTRGAFQGASKAINPSAQIPGIVGRAVAEDAGGVPAARAAPVSSVPLNLAQTTQRPEVASALDTLNAMQVPAAQRTASAQNAAAANALMGRTPGEASLYNASAAAGSAVPEEIAARGSTAATRAVQQAAKISNTEERRVWNKPSLTKPAISTATGKRLVGGVVAALRRDHPGLADAYDHSTLPAIVKDLLARPEMDSASELNSISSRLRTISRNPDQDGDVRLVARQLAEAAQDGVWRAPEVAGAPATTTLPEFPEPGWARAAAEGRPVITPEVKPDPELVRDLQAARAFTRREAETLGHASFDNIVRRNARGNDRVVPGTALSQFFDFKNGVQRPGDIRNVSRFLDDIRSEWLKLGVEERANTFDPATIGPVRRQLETGAQNYLFANMLDRITSPDTDLEGNRLVQWKQAGDWIDTNEAMLERTGLVSPDQMDFLRRFRDTAKIIRRGQQLGKTVGSPTFTRAVHPIRFVDLFTGPLIGRVMSAASGAATGALAVHWLGEAAIGAMIGAEIGGAGRSTTLLQALYRVPRERLLEMLGEAYRNPPIAHDLAARVSTAGNARPSAATQVWMRSLLAAQVPTATATMARPEIVQ